MTIVQPISTVAIIAEQLLCYELKHGTLIIITTGLKYEHHPEIGGEHTNEWLLRLNSSLGTGKCAKFVGQATRSITPCEKTILITESIYRIEATPWRRLQDWFASHSPLTYRWKRQAKTI